MPDWVVAVAVDAAAADDGVGTGQPTGDGVENDPRPPPLLLLPIGVVVHQWTAVRVVVAAAAVAPVDLAVVVVVAAHQAHRTVELVAHIPGEWVRSLFLHLAPPFSYPQQ